MKISLHSVQTRLLAAFALVTVTTLAAAGAGLFSFAVARTAMTDLVEEAAPLAEATKSLEATSGAITGQLAAFARSRDQIEATSAEAQLNSLLADASAAVDRMEAAGLNPGDLAEIQTTLDDLAARVTDATGPVARKLEAREMRGEQTNAALRERQQAATGLETELDTAADPDEVESLLRAIMGLNLIATEYAELDAVTEAEAVDALENRYLDAADELFVNLAILGGSVSDEVRVTVNSFLERGEGETGLFDLARRELTASENADFAVEEARMAGAMMSQVVASVADVAQTRTDQAMASGNSAIAFGTVLIAIIAVVAVALSTAIAYFYVNNNLLKRLTGISRAMSALADGDTSREVDDSGRDEIAGMARSVEVFRENAIERQRLESETAAERQAREARAKSIEELVKGFDDASSRALNAVSEAANEMEMAANALTESSHGASQKTADANEAGSTAAQNVDTVAAAAEEMTSSISEIAQQISRSSDIAQQAASRVGEANHDVRTLSDAAHKIDGVVKLINDIAEQTNLLALNATIEAARAGEAGKGFAVVASEVKTLASQTASATGSISEQITGIQDATQKAVDAIANIGEVISEMNEISTAIAAAMEEQRAAASEITRSAQEAAGGTRRVAESIQGVDATVSETGQCAAQVNQAASSLNTEAEDLRGAVARFLDGVRAA
ncbi:methyl-accepting chemotaxis protein [Marinicauda sp. Alg238-R41]|uniref:methyl-accepting chemotaxis protein n=1 Tax=Marinicauda sp. Alg238-R41 TaxID=2993447 RepID=UPI0022E2844B|nr:methyl-accepting chemotaxis protein [Marinicauda sp. Alg238-R41]